MGNQSNKKENIFWIFFSKFIRIQDTAYWIAVSFLGFILGITSLSFSTYIIPFLVLLISIFCIISFTFSINNLYDVETDKKNKRRIDVNPIASRKFSLKTSKIIILTLTVIPLIISFIFGYIKLFLFTASLLFLGWAYSAPPLRLKGRPGFDLLIHFLGFFLYVIYGSYIAGRIEYLSILVAASVGLASCISQMANHIMDYIPDKESGILTFAVWVGKDKAKITMYLFVVLHLILIIPILIIYALNSYGVYLILFAGLIFSLYLSTPKKTFDIKKIKFIVFIFYFSLFIYLSIAYSIIASFSSFMLNS